MQTDLLQSALQTLSTPTGTQSSNTAKCAREWGWMFHQTGRETAEEKDQLEAMRSAAVRFASDLITGQPPRWLWLCGHSGVGKSHLARRIAAFIAKWGKWAYDHHGRPAIDPGGLNPDKLYSGQQGGPVFVPWAVLVDAGRDGDFAAFRQASNDWFKVIDDVGAEGLGQDRRPTQFVVNQLAKLADARLGKWTVWTSNFTQAEAAETFDVRIASRMMREGNAIVECTARDYNVRTGLPLTPPR